MPLIRYCSSCLPAGGPLLAPFEKWLLPRLPGRVFHHHRMVRAVSAPISLRRYSVAMRGNLRRYYDAGNFHFITCSCYRRPPLLGTARRRDLLLTVLEQVRRRYQFVVAGYVIMPEHIHLLISEPQVKTPSTVMQALKLGFARRVIAEAGRHGASTGPTSRKAREVSHPQLFRSTLTDKPALYFPRNVAHPPDPRYSSPLKWPTRPNVSE